MKTQNVQFVNDGPAQIAGVQSGGKTQTSNNSGSPSRHVAIQEAVRAKMQSAGLNYPAAFTAVQREQPELFAGMNEPRIETPEFKIKS